MLIAIPTTALRQVGIAQRYHRRSAVPSDSVRGAGTAFRPDIATRGQSGLAANATHSHAGAMPTDMPLHLRTPRRALRAIHCCWPAVIAAALACGRGEPTPAARVAAEPSLAPPRQPMRTLAADETLRTGSGATLVGPTGWRVVSAPDRLQLIAPEGD